jgi:hypothetical protein
MNKPSFDTNIDPSLEPLSLPTPLFVHDYSCNPLIGTEMFNPADITISCDELTEITVAHMGNGLYGTKEAVLATAQAMVTACNRYDATKRSHTALMKVLQGIASANYREWDPGLNNPEEFVRWAKSVAASALESGKKVGVSLYA